LHYLIESSLTRFIAQVLAVIAMSRLVGVVTRRLGQSLVIAEMIGGIVLGPSLLGWVAPELWGQLFTPDSLATLNLVMPKDTGLARAFARRLETVVMIVFLPRFFASSDLHTRIGLLASVRDWAVAGVAVLVACVGKLGGCSIAARLTGYSWRDARALGVLMNTRGLMELIVLNIGLDLGVISPVAFSMMVIMAPVTTFMAAPLLRWFPPSS
jgi:Kef-type K+ transport system membrane component KefB